MADNGLSPEMNAAIQILKDDHRIKAFNELTASNQAVIQRLDKMEEERKTSVEPVTTPTPEPTPVPPVPPTTPTPTPTDDPANNPPPRIEPTPTPEPPKSRQRWHERYPS